MDAVTYWRTALGYRSRDHLMSVFHALNVADNKRQPRLALESNT